MLTDPKLRSHVEAIGRKFCAGGLADLNEPPLDMFGADAVERWFTEKEEDEIVGFANRLAIYNQSLIEGYFDNHQFPPIFWN